MKYLKKFETQSDYTEAYSDLILPNVSLVTENNKVYCNPLLPPQPDHDYVEIAGVKWATMNIGANSVTDYGRYFQWADTQGDVPTQDGTFPTKTFDVNDYHYGEWQGGSGSGSGSGSDFVWTKYNGNDGKNILEAIDDAATVNWGVNWRMPTNEEFESLIANTTQTLVKDYEGSGVNGWLFTSITDTNKKIFLPYGSSAMDGAVEGKNEYGYYFSKNLNDVFVYGADSIEFFNGHIGIDAKTRTDGTPIRPVYDEGYGLRNNNEEEG